MKMDILYLTNYVHSKCNKVKDTIFLGFVKHHNSIIRNGIDDSQNVKPKFMDISGNISTFLKACNEIYILDDSPLLRYKWVMSPGLPGGEGELGGTVGTVGTVGAPRRVNTK